MKDVIADRLTEVIANPLSFDRLHVVLSQNSLEVNRKHARQVLPDGLCADIGVKTM